MKINAFGLIFVVFDATFTGQQPFNSEK